MMEKAAEFLDAKMASRLTTSYFHKLEEARIAFLERERSLLANFEAAKKEADQGKREEIARIKAIHQTQVEVLFAQRSGMEASSRSQLESLALRLSAAEDANRDLHSDYWSKMDTFVRDVLIPLENRVAEVSQIASEYSAKLQYEIAAYKAQNELLIVALKGIAASNVGSPPRKKTDGFLEVLLNSVISFERVRIDSEHYNDYDRDKWLLRSLDEAVLAPGKSDFECKCAVKFDANEFISLAYIVLLGRKVDPEGLIFYVNRLRNGLHRRTALIELASSQEAQMRAKFANLDEMDDRTFLDKAFRLVLGRAPDASALSHYIGMLEAQKSRAIVIKDLVTSRESYSNPTPDAVGIRIAISVGGWKFRLRDRMIRSFRIFHARNDQSWTRARLLELHGVIERRFDALAEDRSFLAKGVVGLSKRGSISRDVKADLTTNELWGTLEDHSHQKSISIIMEDIRREISALNSK